MAWMIDIIVIAILQLQGGIPSPMNITLAYEGLRVTISVPMPAFAVAVPSSITAW